MLYTKHNYNTNYIWNFNGIQARRQNGAKVLAKQRSQQVYNTIPKSKEWLIINDVVKASGGFIPTFYIFKGEKLHDNHIQNCKPCSFMEMQKKAWMTSKMFKEFLSLFKRSILRGISQSNCHLLI
jgi:hypothetical protein